MVHDFNFLMVELWVITIVGCSGGWLLYVLKQRFWAKLMGIATIATAIKILSQTIEFLH